MDISVPDWIAFFAATIYLLLLPGFNIMRTMGIGGKLHVVEKIVGAFGISVSILVIVSLLVALPFSIGLNFTTVLILETIVIVLSTKEVVGLVRHALKI